ncbi:MAG: dihydroorotase family protein [Candidatus Thermoplasmatota archaeon]|nr:dihydroorotase family protein [Candidatus Thermoplasmatota archaeon]
MSYLVIEGNLWLGGEYELMKCCVGIENGRIVEIKKVLKGEKNLDFGSKLILPSGVDVHVHFREPGLEHKEDFFTGSLAACFGGISYVADMPNTIPKVDSVERFQNKLRIVKNKSCVDFGLYASAVSKELKKLAKLATGFKIYLPEIDFSVYEETLKLIEKENISKPLLVHAEDKNFIKQGHAKNLNEHMKLSWKAEPEAIKKLSSFTKRPLHICHVSAKESLPYLENKNFSSEVALHYLLLNSNSKLKIEGLGKVVPPLRTKEDSNALWQALKANEIDIIASDHAPHTLEEKKDFSEAPPGMPGVETTYPLLLNLVREQKISLARAVELFCEKPASFLKLKKGKIAKGYDADLILVDLNEVQKIKSSKLHSKCQWSAFENFSAVFPLWVFIRGTPIIENLEFVGEKGYGKFISNE